MPRGSHQTERKNKMKKIIAIIMIVCCLFAVVSCDNGLAKDVNAQIEAIESMSAASIPTKAETTTTMYVGEITIENVVTLVTGSVNGKKASTLTTVEREFSDVTGASGLVSTKTSTKWYVDGLGTCENKNGKWDEDGEDFAPSAGYIDFDFNSEFIKSAEYDSKAEVLTLKIKKENVASFLGSFAADDFEATSDATVKITTSAGRIMSVDINYTIPDRDVYIDEDEEDSVYIPETIVSIKAVYSYDYEPITLS